MAHPAFPKGEFDVRTQRIFSASVQAMLLTVSNKSSEWIVAVSRGQNVETFDDSELNERVRSDPQMNVEISQLVGRGFLDWYSRLDKARKSRVDKAARLAYLEEAYASLFGGKVQDVELDNENA